MSPTTRPSGTARAPAQAPAHWLATLLDQAGEHRLYAAMVLVAIHRLPADTVPHLRWPDVDTPGHRLRLAEGPIDIGAGMSALLYWHGCRQRLDHLNAGPVWPGGLRVFVDELGHPYTEHRAAEVVAVFARQAGLPPLTLGALRHPCLTR